MSFYFAYETFYSLAVHHLRKANMILTGSYETPLVSQYLAFDMVDVYENQLIQLQQEGKIHVLNTCIFALVDFAPGRFFRFVSHHSDQLYI